jgi:hypothetical protein
MLLKVASSQPSVLLAVTAPSRWGGSLGGVEPPPAAPAEGGHDDEVGEDAGEGLRDAYDGVGEVHQPVVDKPVTEGAGWRCGGGTFWSGASSA